MIDKVREWVDKSNVLSNTEPSKGVDINMLIQEMSRRFALTRVENANEMEKIKSKTIQMIAAKIDQDLSLDKLLRVVMQLDEMGGGDLDRLFGTKETTQSGGVNLSFNLGAANDAPSANREVLNLKEQPDSRGLLKLVDTTLEAAKSIEVSETADEAEYAEASKNEDGGE